MTKRKYVIIFETDKKINFETLIKSIMVLDKDHRMVLFEESER